MAQFGPHRYDAGGYDTAHTDAYRGARLSVRDLTGSRLVDCDLTGVKVVDGVLVGVDLSGWVDGLVVNGVDVTAFVASELDRRHPERVQLRAVEDAAGFRAMWTTIEGLWSATVRSAVHVDQRVDGEWSLAETLRHLVFITDAWLSRTVLDDPAPYSPLGLPQSWYADPAALGLGDAVPPWEEVLAVRAGRVAVVRGVVDVLQDHDLGRTCARSPANGYPDEPRTVAECLAVLMQEEVEHLRYALRDQALLRRS